MGWLGKRETLAAGVCEHLQQRLCDAMAEWARVNGGEPEAPRVELAVSEYVTSIFIIDEAVWDTESGYAEDVEAPDDEEQPKVERCWAVWQRRCARLAAFAPPLMCVTRNEDGTTRTEIVPTMKPSEVAAKLWPGIALTDAQRKELDSFNQVDVGVPRMKPVIESILDLRRKVSEQGEGYFTAMSQYHQPPALDVTEDELVAAVRALGARVIEWNNEKMIWQGGEFDIARKVWEQLGVARQRNKTDFETAWGQLTEQLGAPARVFEQRGTGDAVSASMASPEKELAATLDERDEARREQLRGHAQEKLDKFAEAYGIRGKAVDRGCVELTPEARVEYVRLAEGKPLTKNGKVIGCVKNVAERADGSIVADAIINSERVGGLVLVAGRSRPDVTARKTADSRGVRFELDESDLPPGARRIAGAVIEDADAAQNRRYREAQERATATRPAAIKVLDLDAKLPLADVPIGIVGVDAGGSMRRFSIKELEDARAGGRTHVRLRDVRGPGGHDVFLIDALLSPRRACTEQHHYDPWWAEEAADSTRLWHLRCRDCGHEPRVARTVFVADEASGVPDGLMKNAGAWAKRRVSFGGAPPGVPFREVPPVPQPHIDVDDLPPARDDSVVKVVTSYDICNSDDMLNRLVGKPACRRGAEVGVVTGVELGDAGKVVLTVWRNDVNGYERALLSEAVTVPWINGRVNIVAVELADDTVTNVKMVDGEAVVQRAAGATTLPKSEWIGDWPTVVHPLCPNEGEMPSQKITVEVTDAASEGLPPKGAPWPAGVDRAKADAETAARKSLGDLKHDWPGATGEEDYRRCSAYLEHGAISEALKEELRGAMYDWRTKRGIA